MAVGPAEDVLWTSVSQLLSAACLTELRVEMAEEEEVDGMKEVEDHAPDVARVLEIERG